METNNPYAAPQAQVLDIAPPSDIPDLADRGTRLGASILDGLIAGALLYLPMLVLAGPGALFGQGGLFDAGRTGTMDSEATEALIRGLIGMGIGGLVLIVVTWHLVQKYGQTMGKRLLHIKVVRKDGSRASLGRIFWLRNVITGLLGAIPFVGYAVALVDSLLIFRESRQCLHDQIADTIVVKA